jgi:hypothetical protein
MRNWVLTDAQLLIVGELHHASSTYGSGEFLQWLLDRGITPYMRT